MDNYTKGETKEVDGPPAFNLIEGTVCMRVSSGSKLRNLMGFAVTKMKEPNTRQMCWNGTGNAVTKTISCVEIMKRKFKGLHQVTKIRYRRVEEYWEPKVEGLERLKVNRDIPAISILLSKDPTDKTEPGYQPPGPVDDFWKEIVQNDQSRKAKIQVQRDRAKAQAVSNKKQNWGKKPTDEQHQSNKFNRKGPRGQRGRGGGRGRGQSGASAGGSQTNRMDTS